LNNYTVCDGEESEEDEEADDEAYEDAIPYDDRFTRLNLNLESGGESESAASEEDDD
jgi:hypothetical protein